MERPRIQRMREGYYRHINRDPVLCITIERYDGKRTIKRNGYQERPVKLWRYQLGSGERADGFKMKGDAIAAALARREHARHRIAWLQGRAAEPVGKRRPASFAVIERGLFDAADGMPYVPNVEAKKDSA